MPVDSLFSFGFSSTCYYSNLYLFCIRAHVNTVSTHNHSFHTNLEYSGSLQHSHNWETDGPNVLRDHLNLVGFTVYLFRQIYIHYQFN